MSTLAPSARRTVELAALGGTALLVLVADQVTKAAVASNLALGERVEVMGDFILLWHSRNTGAAFSLLQFDGSLLIFYVVHVLALGLVAYFARAFAGRSPLLQVLLGMLLGGSLGNLADRVRHGYVTDFISVGVGDVRFPTWNIADAGITVGIVLLLAYLVLLEPRQRESAA